MIQSTLGRTLIGVSLLALLAGIFPASAAHADSKTGRFIAGLAIGAIIGSVLSDRDDDRGYCPPPPPPCPPRAAYRYGAPVYGYSSSGQVYREGYRDGYADGKQNGQRNGYQQGYRDGYADQYRADSGYAYGPYRSCPTPPPCRW